MNNFYFVSNDIDIFSVCYKCISLLSLLKYSADFYVKIICYNYVEVNFIIM